MTHTAIESTHIKSAGYDPAKKHLEVKFANGSVYRYHEVPQGTADDFFKAESKGSFLHVYVKPNHPAILLPTPKK